MRCRNRIVPNSSRELHIFNVQLRRCVQLTLRMSGAVASGCSHKQIYPERSLVQWQYLLYGTTSTVEQFWKRKSTERRSF